MTGSGLNTRKYKPGDVILNNMKPFAKCLHMTSRQQNCSNCFTERNDLLLCPLCGLLRYCDEKCQKEDWENGHAMECNFFKSRDFNDFCDNNLWPEYTFLLLRLYTKLSMYPAVDSKVIAIINGKPQCLKDLPSNHGCEERRQAMLLRSEWLAKKLKAFDPSGDIEVDMLLWWFGIIFKNTYGLMNVSCSKRIGAAIYAGPSLLQHSCKPTALIVNNGQTIQLRAIAEIPEGKEPRLSYLQNKILFGDLEGFPDRRERRNLLLQNFTLECHCELCESRSDSEVDYKSLNMLSDKLSHFDGCDLDAHLCSHEEVVRLLRKIYNEFDEPITRQFHVSLHTAMNKDVDKNRLWCLLWDTLSHLLLTFGHYHPFHVDVAILTLASFLVSL